MTDFESLSALLCTPDAKVLDLDALLPMPLADEAYDLVLCREGYLPPETIWRALRPGGYFLSAAHRDLQAAPFTPRLEQNGLLLAQKPQEGGFLEARPATAADRETILDLYHACADWGPVYGNSSWNRVYPAMEEIDTDLSLDGLFVMTCDGSIIAAISLIPHDDLDELDCWSDLPSCVPVRLGVHPHWQRSRSRIAERMMVYICAVARQRGYQALRFLAAKNNLPACRLYDTLACEKKGKTVMYGHEFLCYEKLL